MAAIVYTRQSFDRQGEGAAVARQLEDCRKLAEARGHEIVAEFSDNDVSAAGGRQRQGFDQALQAIIDGRADVLVAWALDRLTRNRRDTLTLIETCQEHSATVMLVRGSDIDMATPSGRLVADLLAATARAEIDVKSDRQKRANTQRAAQGLPPIGQRAFGYTRDGLNTEPEEADAVRAAYDHLLAGGSLRSIARVWNERGFTTAFGGQWDGSNVRRVLQNPRYAALRYLNGEFIGAGKWPAIVSQETYRAAAAMLADPGRNKAEDRSIKYLLTNIAECGRCDDGTKVATGRTQHGIRVYKCRGRSDLAVRADDVDAYVESVILARLARQDVVDLLAASPSDDVPTLRARMNVLRARMDEAGDLFATGSMTGAQLARTNEKIGAELEAIDERLAEAGRVDVLARFVDTTDVEPIWDELDVLVQRSIVKILFSRVALKSPGRGARRFKPETVQLDWRES